VAAKKSKKVSFLLKNLFFNPFNLKTPNKHYKNLHNTLTNTKNPKITKNKKINRIKKNLNGTGGFGLKTNFINHLPTPKHLKITNKPKNN